MELFKSAPELKVTSLDVSEDYNLITQLLSDIQFAKKDEVDKEFPSYLRPKRSLFDKIRFLLSSKK